MTAHHHDELIELAAILAAGLLRVLDRKSSQNLQGQVNTPLDCRQECRGDVGRKSEDTKPCDHGFRALALGLREILMLPIFAAAVLLVLAGLLGILLCPPWSECARKRRLGLMIGLTGGSAGR